MKYRKLGRTGLKVSEISLGSWLTYGNSVEKETAIRVIDKAYELGINSFDTANVYARGEAEKIVGEALRKYPRESYVIATKVFWPMGDGPNDRGLSRKHVFEQLHASLKRLQLDYVDIYYCHRYDKETPVDETLRTIDDLVRQGKVLYVGVSEWTAQQIQEALGVADRYLLDRIVVNQPQYNMFHRYIEKEVIPVCEQNGISQIVFSPLAQGVLTGKYKRGQALPADSRAADPRANTFIQGLLNDEVLTKVEQLEKIAAELGITLSQLALAWVLRQPNVASALIGASRPEQVEENVKAVDVVLSEDVLEKIEGILA
ncbi:MULTISPECIES: aldo/keto reductase family protein [Geobacillus]|uniref:Voltage-gated potassium channel n=2 Tax=Geobacillus TaxID=129337 RepID=A0A7U9P6T0_GEOTM|nr:MULTISPECIES: aldo/keto reductase family protein [Geobacillus]AKM19200.1 L-glyceraldehyde 3-phosphate reductase [Geobacillus sp. 12AMOR1]ADU94353.1 aldo/keto reductase [Geobacillus sp. Y412MC52]AMQ20772.1 voltage-gated potassium channel [Geobacillus sp. JS12]AMV11125.1 voltage-gated potassium channel [Geobacillus thermoleovorans]AOL34765.1 voltage-gated potassium channel [Geobacillus thermoleovorans]